MNFDQHKLHSQLDKPDLLLSTWYGYRRFNAYVCFDSIVVFAIFQTEAGEIWLSPISAEIDDLWSIGKVPLCSTKASEAKFKRKIFP